MKWKRTDCPTIMSGLVVRYGIDSDVYDGEVNAGREGVSIYGRWPTMSASEIGAVRTVMAMAEHQFKLIASQYDRAPFHGKPKARSFEADLEWIRQNHVEGEALVELRMVER